MAMTTLIDNSLENRKKRRGSASRAAFAGVFAALSMAAANATQQGLPEITVQGQRDVFANNEGKLVTRTERVRYTDLNLATPDGAEELQSRVSATAEDVCHQLLILYPPEASGGFQHTSENCVKNAAANAMEQANKVIAAAKSPHSAG